MKLGQKRTLGFTGPEEDLQLIPPSTLVDIFRASGVLADLQLVFLSACETLELGQALHLAGVPTVICWRTEVEDGAARLFAHHFYVKFKPGDPFIKQREAFDGAALKLRCELREATNKSNPSMKAMVPKYELRVPGQQAVQTDFSPEPIAAGVPVIIHGSGTFEPPPPQV